MKKIIIVVLLVIMYATTQAQAFKRKQFNIDIGYTIGSHKSAFYSPGVLLSVEKGLHKWIGIGGYIGYQYNMAIPQAWWRPDVEYNAHSVPLGISGSFHFYQMISYLSGKHMKADKLDIVAKHSFGLRFDISDTFFTGFDFGASILVRYFITEKAAIYTEFGYPTMGNLVIGTAFKF